MCLTPEGRLLFSMFEFRPASITMDVWEIKVEAAAGKPLSEGRRITQWSTFASGQLDDVNVTADGKTLIARRGQAQGNVYVADLEPGGKAMKNPRLLTNDESDDAAWGWTADSHAVLFESNRYGSWDIFKQDIDRAEAEALTATIDEQEHHPQVSPDGSWVLYLVSKRGRDKATRLLRVPVGGGPPEVVLTGENLKNFSCAREAKLCVVAEEAEGKQMLSTFDPMKGRGERLPITDFDGFGRGILSPQGRLIDKMKSGPEGLCIRVRSLTGGPNEEITFKDLTGEYGLGDWSLNGKAIYLCQPPFEPDLTALYLGLDGRSHVLWKRGISPGYSFDHPIPSPDGKHLVYTVVTYQMNAWMLENF